MEYDFQRHEPCFDRVLFVLTLDRKKIKERIVAGTEAAVRSRMRGNPDAEVICDVTRQLGTFLIEFEQDPDGEWNRLGLAPLREALHTNRWKQPDLEKTAGSFLQQKYQTGDPVRQYAAFRIWEGYLVAREYRNRSAACDRFIESVSPFTLAFQTNTTADFEQRMGRPAPFDPAHRLPPQLLPEDTKLALWYPDQRMGMECACAYESFSPAMLYYLNRLKDWGLCFRQCKVCSRFFLAKSQRYELCSEKCRKAQALQNKRDFDERARENNYDLLYKNECQNWRNKINKAKKTDGFPEERLKEMKDAFEIFKKEALQRKKLIRAGECSAKEFMDWLYQQDSTIVKLSQTT